MGERDEGPAAKGVIGWEVAMGCGGEVLHVG